MSDHSGHGPAPGPYPQQDELIQTEDVLRWIDRRFLRLDPFAFAGHDFREIVAALSLEFDVEPNGIFCVGSGAVGLSLNPLKMHGARLKQFGTNSDLDIALVSEVHFETAWRDLRKAAQPTLAETSELVLENLNWQKKRFFDGAIIANKLLPELSFGGDWLAGGVRVAEGVAVMLDREIEINYWIYRDYWSVRNYVAASLMRCRREVARCQT